MCTHGKGPWDFSCLPVPPFPTAGTHEPALPNTSRTPALIVSSVPFHPSNIGPSFSCCPQTTLAGAEPIPARSSLTNGRISTSETSLVPVPQRLSPAQHWGSWPKPSALLTKSLSFPAGFLWFCICSVCSRLLRVFYSHGHGIAQGLWHRPHECKALGTTAFLHSLNSPCSPSHATDLNSQDSTLQLFLPRRVYTCV